jgi:hypothetical protein
MKTKGQNQDRRQGMENSGSSPEMMQVNEKWIVDN